MGHSMTFKVCNLGSRRSYFNSHYVVKDINFCRYFTCCYVKMEVSTSQLLSRLILMPFWLQRLLDSEWNYQSLKSKHEDFFHFLKELLPSFLLNEAKTQIKLVARSENWKAHFLDGQRSAIILHRFKGFQPLIPNMCNINMTRKNKHFQCMFYQFFNYIIIL